VIAPPNIRTSWPRDLGAGISVFLVALPLNLGIALGCGAPLLSGVVSAAIGGIVVAWLSGSPLSVSGPAAGLTAIVASSIQNLGSFEMFLAAVVLAGVLQIVLGIVGVGALAHFFPSSVIGGMLASVGAIIVLKQLPHALGHHGDFQGDFGFSHEGESNTFSDIGQALVDPHVGSLLVVAVSAAAMLVWTTRKVQSHRVLALVPSFATAVLAGTLVNELFGAAGSSLYLAADEGHRVALPAASAGAMFSNAGVPRATYLFDGSVLLAAVSIALVGSLESLLSIEATDKLDPWKRVSNTNRELIAQGAGNMLAGFLGGLPITAVIARSSANIYAGAHTRLSSFVQGILLCATVMLIPAVLSRIPLASLAAVLIAVGLKLAQPRTFRDAFRSGLQVFLPFIATLVASIATDLFIGLLVGLGVGIAVVLKSSYYSAITVVHDGRDYLVRFTKDVTFVNKLRLRRELDAIPPGASVVIDGTKAELIDHDIYDVLHDFEASARLRDIELELRNLEAKEYRFTLRIR
jgi:MFS superfamily sulfate permease-like transporter